MSFRDDPLFIKRCKLQDEYKKRFKRRPDLLDAWDSIEEQIKLLEHALEHNERIVSSPIPEGAVY